MTAYVSMNDNFLSGWGMAEGKINKFIIECDTNEQADQVAKAAWSRPEMSNINTTYDAEMKPYYSEKEYYVSERHYRDLGEIWKPEV